MLARLEIRAISFRICPFFIQYEVLEQFFSYFGILKIATYDDSHEYLVYNGIQRFIELSKYRLTFNSYLFLDVAVGREVTPISNHNPLQFHYVT